MGGKCNKGMLGRKEPWIGEVYPTKSLMRIPGPAVPVYRTCCVTPRVDTLKFLNWLHPSFSFLRNRPPCGGRRACSAPERSGRSFLVPQWRGRLHEEEIVADL